MTLRGKTLLISYSGVAVSLGILYFFVLREPLLEWPLWQEFFPEGMGTLLLPVLVFLLLPSLVIMALMDKFIVSRIRRIRENVSKIGTSGDFSSRIEGGGKDEVSSLITEINGMLLKLEWSHSELFDREAKLRQITDNMMDLISEINVQGILKFVSPSFKNILGYKEKDLLEKSIYDLMHHSDRRDFVASMKNAMQTASLGLIEFRLRHASGRYLWMESIGNLIFDDKNAVTGVIFGSRDITERKKAEEALRESEEKYKQIVIDIEEGYFETDLEGMLTFYNNSFCKVTGFLKKELKKANLDAIFKNPMGLSTYFPAMEKDQKPQRNLVWNLEKKVGQKVFVEVSLYTVKDKQGQHIGYRGLVRDVTESKLKEQEIKRINVDLERRVAERTAQLEAANKELESFSYSVSHDLRAPLRSIDGFSTALMVDYGDNLEPQARDYLERVRSASQRMGQLIDDLLNLSRVIRSEMHIIEVNISDLAGEVIQEIKEMDPERQVTVNIEPDMLVQGDPRLLKIMLANLLENSWKFTGKTPEACIEFGSTLKDSKSVYYINDNGAGFDMEYADKLFGPFQRLHTPGEFPGTGIGLATVARIIKRHKGNVWAEGEVGKGAAFYFSLDA